MRIGKCYVCNNTSSTKEERIIISRNLWRHKKCHVGSQNWLNSNRAQESGFITIYQTSKKEEKR